MCGWHHYIVFGPFFAVHHAVLGMEVWYCDSEVL